MKAKLATFGMEGPAGVQTPVSEVDGFRCVDNRWSVGMLQVVVT